MLLPFESEPEHVIGMREFFTLLSCKIIFLHYFLVFAVTVSTTPDVPFRGLVATVVDNRNFPHTGVGSKYSVPSEEYVVVSCQDGVRHFTVVVITYNGCRYSKNVGG